VKCKAYFSGVVKIIALTRGIHAPRPCGQLDSCPILLSCRIALALNKIERFSKVSFIGLFRGVKGAFVLDDLLKFGTVHRL
jgi:hypothetical protein